MTRYTPRRMRALVPDLPQEMPEEAKIAAMESELRLLHLYADPKKLRARLKLLQETIHRLRGMPLDGR